MRLFDLSKYSKLCFLFLLLSGGRVLANQCCVCLYQEWDKFACVVNPQDSAATESRNQERTFGKKNGCEVYWTQPVSKRFRQENRGCTSLKVAYFGHSSVGNWWWLTPFLKANPNLTRYYEANYGCQTLLDVEQHFETFKKNILKNPALSRAEITSNQSTVWVGDDGVGGKMHSPITNTLTTLEFKNGTFDIRYPRCPGEFSISTIPKLDDGVRCVSDSKKITDIVTCEGRGNRRFYYNKSCVGFDAAIKGVPQRALDALGVGGFRASHPY